MTTGGCKALIFRGKIIFRRKASEWRSVMTELKQPFWENEIRYVLFGYYYIPNLTLVEEERRIRRSLCVGSGAVFELLLA